MLLLYRHRFCIQNIHHIPAHKTGRNACRTQQHRRRRGKVDAVSFILCFHKPHGEVVLTGRHFPGLEVILRKVFHIFSDPLRVSVDISGPECRIIIFRRLTHLQTIPDVFGALLRQLQVLRHYAC